ncbi:hypothetical protein CVD28_02370 [Bacillus sp. M6-12]|uniref:hypothetical protein n=1 Tax=Bacillus sp. M6-12 TaxID=2054166 RepID=UPI000C7628BF|nr:hypothetical protein [Bacillus sp. M6-12]PLS19277.1 hypothetical protein CVD28_02370 [Bacillus sp. M6-12]
MKKTKKQMITTAMVATTLFGALAPLAHAEVIDNKEETNKTVSTQSTEVQNTAETQSVKEFTEAEKQAINEKINQKNTTRNDLILKAVATDNWDAYNEFEAKEHPAWYEKTADGKYVPNKIYFGNLIESYVFNMREADVKAEQAEDGSVEQQEALKQKAHYQKQIEELLVDFKKAPGIVPYIVGINSSESYAKEYGVEQPANGFFDSKYNHPDVMDKGVFVKEDVVKETTVAVVGGATTPEVTTKTNESVSSAVSGESTETVVKEEVTTTNDDFVYDVEIVDDGVFTEEEKQAIDKVINHKNMTRNDLILDAVATGDWSAYHAFEAKSHPAWYEKTEDGKYVPNKIYFGNLIESSVFSMREADAKYEQAEDGSVEKEQALIVKKIWEANVQDLLIGFKKAPGIVPYVIGINSNESYAKEFGVEQPANGFFDSKYNHPSVMDKGVFAE